MAFNSNELGIEQEVVQLQLEASLGIARYYNRLAKSDTLNLDEVETSNLIAAANFRTAGENLLWLNNTKKAQYCFKRSADSFLSAGSSYGYQIANLGPNGHDINISPPQSYQQGLDVFALWPEVLSNEFNYLYSTNEYDYGNINMFRGEPVGMLGIPTALYLNLFKAITSISKDPDSKSMMLQQALYPFVYAYSTALIQARSDEYHWTRLAMPFHPFESEIMSVIVGTQRALKHHKNIVLKAIELIPIEDTARSLITSVLRQYKEDVFG